MKIRLRKAQAILKKAQELMSSDKSVDQSRGSSGHVVIHVSHAHPEIAWLEHQSAIRSKIDSFFQLESAYNWLTVEATRAGAETVSVLLKSIALKKNSVKILSDLVEGIAAAKLSSAKAIEQALAEKKHDSQLAEKSMFGANAISAFWADQDALDHYTDELKAAKKQLLKLEDELAAANLSIEITVPPHIVEILDKHSLV